MQYGLRQQDLAVASGYWPLIRYNPVMRRVGENPFRLDSPRPTVPFKEYAYNELRYRALTTTRPQEAAQLAEMAQVAVIEKYRMYEQLAGLDGGRFQPPAEVVGQPPEP
jgi:pyruvate-ferredoxin/flavodoxin oxidoreductase